jgi:hypothetical protein
MAFIKLQFRPGLNRDTTNYSNEGGFYECDKVRFRSGFPQKLGGWRKITSVFLLGICRQMFNYITSFSDNLLWLGTNKKLYIEVGGNLQDVTPLRATFATPDTDNCFATTTGSDIITVTIISSDPVIGDYVTFSGAVAVGGIPAAQLNANHEILTAPDSDTFTIQVSAQATSTVAAGGGSAIDALFDIPVGPEVDIYGYGWGAGAWSRDGWGSGTLTPLTTFQRDWWFDNFDNDTVMNIRNGAIYYWAYDPTFLNRAALLSARVGASNVPNKAMQTLISQNDKHLLAFGTQPFGGLSTDFDPLLIRWANQDEPENWTPSPTNSAGFLRVSRGSKIVRALPTRQEILVWTDTHLYTLQFLGTTDVFSLQEYADNVSIMGSRAAITSNNVVYWMGVDKFYTYTGRVETLPCTLRDHVFNNFNFEQAPQVVCGTNEQWHEIWWFYPTANSNTNDAYVIFNYLERVWYYGSLNRTSWLDTPLRKFPQATCCDYLYNHEDGVDNDVLPMDSFITSSDVDLDDGDKFILTKRMLPDINFGGSTVPNPQIMMTLKPRNFPGGGFLPDETADVTRTIEVPVEQYTNQIFLRARARQMAIKISSTGLGVNWQLGSPRLDGKPDGQR